jgi:hypothetical protein
MTINWVRRAAALAVCGAAVTACGGADDARDPVGSGSGGAGSAASFGGAGGGAAGEPGEAAAPGCAQFVTDATDFEFGPGQDTGQTAFPGPILGPPKGGGATQGSLDVVSLGNGGHVTVAFGQSVILDGEGPDFIVFENAFDVGGDPETPFAELATVEVSPDGKSWTAFPCTATAYPYGQCAGWHPVYANADDNAIDPLDPDTAGGDAFDLADIGVTWARYVRITDRADQVGPAGVFDLDAVGAVHVECP